MQNWKNPHLASCSQRDYPLRSPLAKELSAFLLVGVRALADGDYGGRAPFGDGVCFLTFPNPGGHDLGMEPAGGGERPKYIPPSQTSSGASQESSGGI